MSARTGSAADLAAITRLIAALMTDGALLGRIVLCLQYPTRKQIYPFSGPVRGLVFAYNSFYCYAEMGLPTIFSNLM